MHKRVFVQSIVAAVAVQVMLAAPQAPAGRGGAGAAPVLKPPPLFFRESFNDDKATISARPLLTTDVTNPNLELKMYGPGAPAKPDHESGLQLYVANDAMSGGIISWVWSGMTEGNWAVTVRDKRNLVDLSGAGKIRWRIRERGFNALHPVVKLADGTMLVGDYGEAESTFWRQNELFLIDVPRWRVLIQEEVMGSTDPWRAAPDLTKVDEVGFTDLMRGTGHGKNGNTGGGNSGVDWIEVYGNAVKR